jgi:hypothetical protein
MSISLDKIKCTHKLSSNFVKKQYITADKTSVHCYVNIKDSIHYKSLCSNDFTMYNHYISTSIQPEHSEQVFRKLIDNFDITQMKPIKIVYNFKRRCYVIVDGVHRLSILVFKGLIQDTVPLEYLDIEFDKDTLVFLQSKLKKPVGVIHYNGWNNRTEYGYHSFNIYNFNVVGQRNPKHRLDIIRQYVDFTDKTVVDLGCNSGGMLLHLPEIKQGCGIDYDENCISFANEFVDILGYNNTVSFVKGDLNNVHIKTHYDICFLLSIGSWVKNWKQLYTQCMNTSNTIILETNNDKEGIPQLELFKQHNYDVKMISAYSTDDSTNNYGRKMYLISKLI